MGINEFLNLSSIDNDNFAVNILTIIVDILVILGVVSAFIRYISKNPTVSEEKSKDLNIRNKAREIDKNTLPVFIQLINDLLTHLNEKTYIEFDKLHPLTLKLDSNIFINNLSSSDIFKVENNQIILTYTQDAHLNRHMSVILKHLNDYYESAYKLKTTIDFLSNSTPPLLFSSDLKKIALEEFGKERVTLLNPNYDDYFAVYFVTMTGSQKAYVDGHSFVKELLKNRFEDLQLAVIKNDEDAQTIKEIQEELHNIELYLNSAYDEIQKLHEVWQNKLII